MTGCAASTDVGTEPGSKCLELHPQVALRPEPFGALAYHYGNRRLIFLKHPDVVRVVRELANHATLDDTLRACDINPKRWKSFAMAIDSLINSEVVRERHHTG